MKKILVAFLVLGQLLAFWEGSTAQIKTGLAALNPREAAFVPSGFYISSVFDERTGPDSIGTLLFSSNEKSVTHKIALESGTFVGITKILANRVARNTSLRPLSIRIKEYKIKEILSGSDRVIGEVNLILMFDLAKDNGSVPLTQYKSTAKYARPLGNLTIVEPTFRNVLDNGLKFIDNWLTTEAPRNLNFAKGVKLTFHDYLEQHEDTVYYDPARPLIWDDFREKRAGGNFAASVFPSFGYSQRTKMEDGIVNVELIVKVFVVKSASWVAPGTRSNYNLNHEQKHFELVKLVAERFKKKLLAEKLSPDTYQSIINFEYLEFYREMNKIQREYDEQTSHGSSAVIQEFWDRKIATELSLIDN